MLRHGAGKILELKATVALELKVGNRPAPKRGFVLGKALPTATSQQEREKNKRVSCSAANARGAAVPRQTARKNCARHSKVSIVATHPVVYPSTRQ
jgi:hypothetical protein